MIHAKRSFRLCLSDAAPRPLGATRLISGAKLFVRNITVAAVLLAVVCAGGGRQ